MPHAGALAAVEEEEVLPLPIPYRDGGERRSSRNRLIIFFSLRLYKETRGERKGHGERGGGGGIVED